MVTGAVPAKGASPNVASFRRTLAEHGLAGDTVRRTGTFAAAGIAGLALNTGVLWLWVGRFNSTYVLGAVLATQASATWDFYFVERLLHHGAPSRGRAHRYLMFLLANDLIMLARIPLLVLLVSALHWNILMANLLTFVLVPLLRFIMPGRGITRSKGR